MSAEALAARSEPKRCVYCGYSAGHAARCRAPVTAEPVYWRVVVTDTELPTGVSPVCSKPDVHAMQHGGAPDDDEIYDECCTGDAILECWSEHAAREVLATLNRLFVEMPS